MRNLENLKNFRIYLRSKKLSQKSIKNYVSDVRQFLKWTAKNNFKNLTSTVFATYKSHLLDLKTPTKSINRYLTSLRKFGQFLKEEKLMMVNPAENLENIKGCQCRVFTSKLTGGKSNVKTGSLHIEKFREALIQERLKPATIKNYISDVNQFLKWLEKKNYD